MAMRFVRVEKGGEYRKVPGALERSAYITMMQVRAVIVVHSARELSKGELLCYPAVFLKGRILTFCLTGFFDVHTSSLYYCYPVLRCPPSRL